MQEKDTFLSKTARALALIQDISTSIAELEKRLASLKTELDGVTAKPALPEAFVGRRFLADTVEAVRRSAALALDFGTVTAEGDGDALRVNLPLASENYAGLVSAAFYAQAAEAFKRLEEHEKYIDILRQEEVVCRCKPADGRVVFFKISGTILPDKSSTGFVVVEATDGVIKRKDIPEGYNAVSPYDCEEINYFDLQGFNHFGRFTIIKETLPERRYSLKIIEGLTNMEDITTMYQIDGWGIDFPDLERVRGEWNTVNCKSFCQTFCHYWPDKYTLNFVEIPSRIETGNALNLEHIFFGLKNIREFPDIDARSATTCMWMCDWEDGGPDDVRARFLNIGTQRTLVNDAIYLRIRDWNVGDMRDTLINYSFDRAAAGYKRVIIYTSQNNINKLTREELAAITAKGYTLTIYK